MLTTAAREQDVSLTRFFMIDIDGKKYLEVPVEKFAFGNACNYCAFKGTDCYNRNDFDCHGDSRTDGRSIVFKEAKTADG